MELNGRVLNEQINFAAIGRALGMEPWALFQYMHNLIPGGCKSLLDGRRSAAKSGGGKHQITIVKLVKVEDKAVYRGFMFQKKRQNKDGSKQEWHCNKHKEKNG
uniref:Uncharacterized protein n=1 Tax=Ditylenchus dipsaci TaxID=166011 RepID=A0A915D581_9BILA